MSPTIIVEKEGLLPSAIVYQSKHEAFSSLRRAIFISLSFACILTGLSFWRGNLEIPDVWDASATLAETCPQSSALEPTQNGELWKGLIDNYGTSQFFTRAVNWLGGAIQVK